VAASTWPAHSAPWTPRGGPTRPPLYVDGLLEGSAQKVRRSATLVHRLLLLPHERKLVPVAETEESCTRGAQGARQGRHVSVSPIASASASASGLVAAYCQTPLPCTRSSGSPASRSSALQGRLCFGPASRPRAGMGSSHCTG